MNITRVVTKEQRKQRKAYLKLHDSAKIGDCMSSSVVMILFKLDNNEGVR